MSQSPIVIYYYEMYHYLSPTPTLSQKIPNFAWAWMFKELDKGCKFQIQKNLHIHICENQVLSMPGHLKRLETTLNSGF